MKKKFILPPLLLLSIFTNIFSQTQWVCATAKAQFKPRGYHSSIAFKNKLWVLNGIDTDSGFADIWNTTDGKNWNCANSNVPYPMRAELGLLIFNDDLWIVAGGLTC